MVEVNIEEEPALGQFFRIRAVPKLVFFKDCEPVDGIVGAPAAAVLRSRRRRRLPMNLIPEDRWALPDPVAVFKTPPPGPSPFENRVGG